MTTKVIMPTNHEKENWEIYNVSDNFVAHKLSKSRYKFV